MLLIARVNALGTVADKKIFVKFITRVFLKNGNTDFFCCTWVNGRFVDDDMTRFKNFANGCACRYQMIQIRAFISINRRWHSDDEYIASAEVCNVMAARQLHCPAQFFSFNFACAIIVFTQLLNTPLVYIET